MQSPFLTLFLEIDEKDMFVEETAMIIEEIIKQRIQGVKNKNGAYTTPAFPKLVYVLDEHNCLKGGKYDYITKLCAKCNVERIYPDYISAKVMRKLHDGEVFSCMGCVDGKEVVPYRYKGINYVESFERMWGRLLKDFKEKPQTVGSYNLYINVENVQVYDSSKQDFVDVYRIIRNIQSQWLDLKFSNGRCLRCTIDHPFETQNRGVVQAKDLSPDDIILMNKYLDLGVDTTYSDTDLKKAWMYGVALCDSSYKGTLNISLGSDEKEVIAKFTVYADELYDLEMYEYPLNRGKKGSYIDLRARGNGSTSISIRHEYKEQFEGLRKSERHIPTCIWNSPREVRLAFLAGMLDADGYINVHGNSVARVQIGSTNKELALQQMYLVQSLGYFCRMYKNHYNKKDYSKVRYLCEFDSCLELDNYLTLSKKKSHNLDISRTHDSIYSSEVISLTEKTFLEYEDYSYDVTTETEHFDVSGIYSHNCRSFLSEWKDENGDYKWEGRFNQGVVSINLPQVGLIANGDMDLFWEELEKRLYICFKALMCRHKALEGTLSDVSAIHWQNGCLARLEEGETIDKYLHDGYSTLSLGYIGLYETTVAMLGVSHTTLEGKEFALKVLNRLKQATENWKAETGLGFGLYGTPAESLCYRFCKIDKEKFGVVEDITDKGWYTNSYHVDVRENINAFDKLAFESKFQEISTGGCISYVELPNLQNNIEAVEELIKYIYDTIMYAEFNSKSDYCLECNYNGEIKTVLDEKGDLVWECPNCHNRNQNRMIVVRRTCGYLGQEFWNVGKTKEIASRVLHL